jgi:hypothetical protein
MMANLILETYNIDGESASVVIEDAQEFIDSLVSLDQQKTAILLGENEATTAGDAVLEAEALDFLAESILGYLDTQVEEGEITAIDYLTMKTCFETAGISAVEISIVEDDGLFTPEEEQLYSETISELGGLTNSSSLISENIANVIDDMTYVGEVVYHKVVRHGVLKKLLDCPPGFKSAGGKCVRMQSTEIRKRMKAALKANKTKKREFSNSAFRNNLMKMRVKSLKLRKARGLK